MAIRHSRGSFSATVVGLIVDVMENAAEQVVATAVVKAVVTVATLLVMWGQKCTLVEGFQIL